MTSSLKKKTPKIKGPVGVVGLGYVGLPVAVHFAKRLPTIGFDIKESRIRALQRGVDETGETSKAELKNPRLKFTTDPTQLRKCEFIIVAVPTPIDRAKNPDLEPLRSSSTIVGQNLSHGTTVVYESTVYPGVTEEFCLPILEKESGLTLGQFKIGYSPERINPGDKTHTIDKIIKIVSGCDEETLDRVAALYSLIAKAGIHRAPNIKTAEAAKVIENIQRDLNIALMNELSMIFARLGIRTKDVLDAAGTKWNFQKFHPGLVGGHCIGVDPYYLTYRALELGFHPTVILAGRAINDSMGRHVGEMVVKALNHWGKVLKGARVLIMGLTFKEDVPDIRNSRVLDTIEYLRQFEVEVIGCDPLLGNEVVKREFGVENKRLDEVRWVDCVVVANRHRAFQSVTLLQLKQLMPRPILVDIKHLFSEAEAVRLGFHYLSL
jgi:UDP-N-acetyl-D-galactosamine dehydrogenase